MLCRLYLNSATYGYHRNQPSFKILWPLPRDRGSYSECYPGGYLRVHRAQRCREVDGTFGYISPFKWVNVNVLSPSYSIEPWRIIAFIGMSALLLLVSGFIYRRKDILT